MSAEAADRRFTAMEFVLPRHASAPLHTHPPDETYIVVDGRLTVRAGADRFTLEPGGVGAVPMGVPHTFDRLSRSFPAGAAALRELRIATASVETGNAAQESEIELHNAKFV